MRPRLDFESAYQIFISPVTKYPNTLSLHDREKLICQDQMKKTNNGLHNINMDIATKTNKWRPNVFTQHFIKNECTHTNTI